MPGYRVRWQTPEPRGQVGDENGRSKLDMPQPILGFKTEHIAGRGGPLEVGKAHTPGRGDSHHPVLSNRCSPMSSRALFFFPKRSQKSRFLYEIPWLLIVTTISNFKWANNLWTKQAPSASRRRSSESLSWTLRNIGKPRGLGKKSTKPLFMVLLPSW